MEVKLKKQVTEFIIKNLRWIILLLSIIIFWLILEDIFENEIGRFDNAIYSAEEVENLDEALANGAEIVEKQEVKVEIGQTMAFVVLAFSELVHVFNIRNNKKSIFKTHPFNNKVLLGAIGVSAALMLVILFVPTLRHLFSIPILPMGNVLEIIGLVLLPLVIVEIFKSFKINTSKDEV